MPTYRCSGKGCGFATEDLDAFVRHVLNEKLLRTLPTAEPRKARTHQTVRDYLNCPECYARFEKVLLARGWKKKSEEKAEKKSRLL